MSAAQPSSSTAPRRGRPPKYGRPSQLVSLTLPTDVLAWLKGLHSDPAWAIVNLFERYRDRPTLRGPKPDCDLVQLPGRRALIVVRPEPFRGLDGVSLIPLQDGRAFLALQGDGGLAQLEVALADRSEEPGLTASERKQLRGIRDRVKSWRRSGIRFESRSIIVAQLAPAEGRAPGPLGELKTGRDRSPASKPASTTQSPELSGSAQPRSNRR